MPKAKSVHPANECTAERNITNCMADLLPSLFAWMRWCWCWRWRQYPKMWEVWCSRLNVDVDVLMFTLMCWCRCWCWWRHPTIGEVWCWRLNVDVDALMFVLMRWCWCWRWRQHANMWEAWCRILWLMCWCLCWCADVDSDVDGNSSQRGKYHVDSWLCVRVLKTSEHEHMIHACFQ